MKKTELLQRLNDVLITLRKDKDIWSMEDVMVDRAMIHLIADITSKLDEDLQPLN